jgi:hypothetical protein
MAIALQQTRSSCCGGLGQHHAINQAVFAITSALGELSGLLVCMHYN